MYCRKAQRVLRLALRLLGLKKKEGPSIV